MDFENWKVSSKLIAGFSLVLALTVGTGVFSIMQMGKVYSSAHEMEVNWTPSIVAISDMNTNTSDFRIAELQHILSTSKEDMSAWEKEMDGRLKAFRKNEAVYKPLIASAEEKALYDRIDKLFTEYLAENRKVVELSNANSNDEAKALLRGKSQKLYDEFSDLLAKDVELNVQGGRKETRHGADLYQSARSWVLGALLSSVVLAGCLGAAITRAITRPLGGEPHEMAVIAKRVADGDLTLKMEKACDDASVMAAMRAMVENLRQLVADTVDISAGIASAANELHSTSEQIATGAEEVAVQTSGVATASEEMASTSNDISRNCSLAAEVSRETARAAKDGAAIVNNAIEGMNAISRSVKESSNTVAALGARSQQIGEIVVTIEDIADQTNLLALNAAIEAARAGEQGRGFAVVADEVRALAVRTTAATREIGEMIRAIQNDTKAAVRALDDGVREVEQGVAYSHRSGEALEGIIGHVDKVTEQIDQIATAAQEQTATTDEVTGNIQQVTEIVQHSARGAEETAAAASQLAQQSQQLQDLVGRFKLA